MKVTKKQIISKLFKICKKRNNFTFNNELVKNVIKKVGSNTNPYDMTKLDHTSKFPDILLKEDYFIAHLGKGKHQFIKGINKIFHRFEEIEENEIIDWVYRPSILNDFSVSESSVLSLCFNHRIIHDFLYLDIVSNPKVYNSERKRGVSFEYKIDNINMSFENLQIEIDLTMEYKNVVTVFEGKNTKNSLTWLENFNIYQLYNPFRYYYNLKKEKKLDIEKITASYLVRQKKEDGSFLRLYNYSFENPFDITSIKLIKKREYHLKRRDFNE